MHTPLFLQSPPFTRSTPSPARLPTRVVALCHKPTNAHHEPNPLPLLLHRPEAVVTAPVAALLLLSDYFVTAGRNAWQAAQLKAAKTVASRRLRTRLHRREREREYLQSALLATEATLSNTRVFLANARRRQIIAQDRLAQADPAPQNIQLQFMLRREREGVHRLRGEVALLEDKLDDVQHELDDQIQTDEKTLQERKEVDLPVGILATHTVQTEEMQDDLKQHVRSSEDHHLQQRRQVELQIGMEGMQRTLTVRPIQPQQMPLTNPDGLVTEDGTKIKRKRGRPRKTAPTPIDPNKPKRPRGRPRKTPLQPTEVVLKPRRPRGRPRKTPKLEVDPEQPKRKRGRPRKDESFITQ